MTESTRVVESADGTSFEVWPTMRIETGVWYTVAISGASRRAEKIALHEKWPLLYGRPEPISATLTRSER